MTDRRVFVVQRPAYFDRQRRGWVNKYDLGPAKEHGELTYLLPPGNIYKERLEAAVAELDKQLADFCESDCIMAIGDPVAIAITVMLASKRTGGRVTLLKWDRQDERYDPYVIDVSSLNSGSSQ